MERGSERMLDPPLEEDTLKKPQAPGNNGRLRGKALLVGGDQTLWSDRPPVVASPSQ